MEYSAKSVIRKRRSVRTYSGETLREEDRLKLEEYIKTLKNPFDVQIEFRFLDAKQYGLSSPVILGTDLYLGAKVPHVPNSEIAFGYDFEQFVLYAWSLGIGTVWLAGTLNRSAFEKAMEVKDTEYMPAVTPIGYPAEKMSVRESLMRKGVKADERLPFETLFFKDSFSAPLTADDAGRFREALEMVRLAPSAVNKQPWRAVVCGDTVHFYEKKTKALSQNATSDLQKVDVGIALLHFALTIEEDGMKGRFLADDPKLKQEEDVGYIISYRVD
ncbi:MAG: nitroreductase [Acetatifactor sp.]|nr:nitroreductase [Acetatifactor sp.]